MKVSVSLPAEDVDFLDAYALSEGIGSRSAAMHKAVRMLQAAQLSVAYEQAWAEWAESSDADRWESAAGDGLA